MRDGDGTRVLDKSRVDMHGWSCCERGSAARPAVMCAGVGTSARAPIKFVVRKDGNIVDNFISGSGQASREAASRRQHEASGGFSLVGEELPMGERGAVCIAQRDGLLRSAGDAA